MILSEGLKELSDLLTEQNLKGRVHAFFISGEISYEPMNSSGVKLEA